MECKFKVKIINYREVFFFNDFRLSYIKMFRSDIKQYPSMYAKKYPSMYAKKYPSMYAKKYPSMYAKKYPSMYAKKLAK